MSKKIIHTNINNAGRLYCDNPTCGHVLAEHLDFSEKLIGYPCPECGWSMLTAEDYVTTARLYKVVDWINKYFGWMGIESPDDCQVTVSVKVKDGAFIIKEKL